MEEFKGTKGNWEFLDTDNYCEIQVKQPLISICAVNKIFVKEYSYNAKLIAAAPELLEALQKLTNSISDGNNILLSEWNLKSKVLINNILK